MAIKTPLLILALFLSFGCSRFTPGVLYTHTVRPISADFDRTAVGSKRAYLDEHRVSEPFSGVGLSVEWTAERIRTAAEAAGMKTITFTEEETLSFLLGLYQRRRLIIYGD